MGVRERSYSGLTRVSGQFIGNCCILLRPVINTQVKKIPVCLVGSADFPSQNGDINSDSADGF